MLKKNSLIVKNIDISYSYKFSNRTLLSNLVKSLDSNQDVLIAKNGKIYDTTIANIAFFDGHNWLTPRVPLLKGTTRSRLLKNNFIKTADIKIDDVKKYKKIALLNSLSGFYEFD